MGQGPIGFGLLSRPKQGFARLVGADRSGPPPAATQKGAPWNPWTIPNAIAAFRLAGIPVFLWLALSSPDGKDVTAAIIYAVIGWSDYADGFIARLTGQYSRLGAILDPVADRALAIAGMYVAWEFDLLPRWAVAIVLFRELLMLVVGQWAIRRGAEVRVNWPGRLGVAPILAAPFWAMIGFHTFALILLFSGIALTWWATVLYARDVRHQIS